MIIYSDPFGSGSVILGVPEPPDSVPLEILGLDSIPATRQGLIEAFRQRVRDTHPDHQDVFNPINVADRASIEQSAEFQQVVWARDVLLPKTHDPSVTGGQSSTAPKI